VTKLAAILDQIDSGSVLLPEFQRGYVWNRDQVRGLMRSLYLGYPVGGLLTWETQADGSLIRGEAAVSPALRVLILDGQQRVTSLYGITRGRPPAFFQGDEKVFTNLRFNVQDETFECYAPAKMREDPKWIEVTSLFTRGLEHHIGVLNAHPDTQPRIVSYMGKNSASPYWRPTCATSSTSTVARVWTDMETERILLAAARVGQHVFAHQVLANCGSQCVLCGLRPSAFGATRMLLAGTHQTVERHHPSRAPRPPQ
jgi:Protein of unknown function DUF262